MEPIVDHERRIRALEAELDIIKMRSRGYSWGTWTPTLTQGVSVAATVSGQYTQIGKLVVVSFAIVATAAGTAANRVAIGGMPGSAVGVNRVFGGADIQDAGTRNIHAAMYMQASGVFWMIENNMADVVGIASSYTVASGDTITGFGVYQVP